MADAHLMRKTEGFAMRYINALITMMLGCLMAFSIFSISSPALQDCVNFTTAHAKQEITLYGGTNDADCRGYIKYQTNLSGQSIDYSSIQSKLRLNLEVNDIQAGQGIRVFGILSQGIELVTEPIGDILNYPAAGNKSETSTGGSGLGIRYYNTSLIMQSMSEGNDNISVAFNNPAIAGLPYNRAEAIGFQIFYIGQRTSYDAQASSDGSSSPRPVLEVCYDKLLAAISNTSFNVTNYPDLISNSTAWSSNAYINVSNNLIAFTFSTNTAVNASCMIGQDLNYTSMAAAYPSSKLTTTMATSHSTNAVYGNLSAYQDSCVYCAYSTGAIFAKSGCLKTMYSDIKAPYINRTSQHPADIAIFNALGYLTFVNFNISDYSEISSAYLYHKSNNSYNDYSYFINGTSFSGYKPKTPFKISGTNYTFNMSGNKILPGTYNIGEDYMETTAHTTTTTAVTWEFRFFNVSKLSTYNFYEVMTSGGTASRVDIYYCNSTYVTGEFGINSNCVIFGNIPSGQPYNHTHSAFSSHHVVPFTIIDGYIGSVKVTDTSYMINEPIAGTRSFYYLPANASRSVQQTSTGGVSWIDNPAITFDAHIHQFSNATLFYYACANDTFGNINCSQAYSDMLEPSRLPPSSVNVYSPLDSYYNSNITINYTQSIPSQIEDMKITYYSISLYSKSFSYLQAIANNSENLGYLFNTENLTSGNYSIGARAFDNYSQSSIGFSEIFIFDNDKPVCVNINNTPFYPSENSTIYGELTDNAALDWIQFIFNGTIISNTSISGASYDISISRLIPDAVNETLSYNFTFADRAGNTGSCSRSAMSEERPVITPFFIFAECPNTFEKILVFVIFCAFGLIIAGIGIYFYSGLTTIFGSLILFFASISLIFCHLLMGAAIMFFMLVMMVYGAKMMAEGCL